MAAVEWPEKTKLIVTIVVGALLSIGAWAGVYHLNGKYEELQKQIKAVQADIIAKQAIANQKPELESEIRTIESSMKKHLEKLPTEEEASELIDSLGQVIKKFGIIPVRRIRETQAGLAGQSIQDYSTDTWRTTWKGEFHNWCRFMNHIEERHRRLISFEDLTITGANNGKGIAGAKHNIRVNLVTYRYTPPAD